jgi:hypothetical protein
LLGFRATTRRGPQVRGPCPVHGSTTPRIFRHPVCAPPFVSVVAFNKQVQRSGMFCYDPARDAWHEIEAANPIPPHKSWMGWMRLCYDVQHDCFIGMIADKLYKCRYQPK